jgi:hypothetical protein
MSGAGRAGGVGMQERMTLVLEAVAKIVVITGVVVVLVGIGTIDVR